MTHREWVVDSMGELLAHALSAISDIVVTVRGTNDDALIAKVEKHVESNPKLVQAMYTFETAHQWLEGIEMRNCVGPNNLSLHERASLMALMAEPIHNQILRELSATKEPTPPGPVHGPSINDQLLAEHMDAEAPPTQELKEPETYPSDEDIGEEPKRARIDSGRGVVDLTE